MKKRFLNILLIILSLLLCFCTREAEESDKILARINDYKLKWNEFQTLLSQESQLEPDFKVPRESKEKFLEEIIQKELLIQEAKRLELDRRDKFVRAIERYWEATLIRDLMELKGEEIEKTTLVTEEEINSRYAHLDTAEKENYPSGDLKNKIALELMENKRSIRLRNWIEELVGKADIEVNKDLL